MKILFACLFLIFCYSTNAQTKLDESLHQRYVIYEVKSVGHPQLVNSVEEALSDSAIGYNQVGDGTIILKLDTETGDTWILGSLWFGDKDSSTSKAVHNWIMVQHAPYIGRFKNRVR